MLGVLISMVPMQLQEIVLQPESGRLVGIEVSTERPGSSGKGYLVGLDADGDHAVLEFTAKGGNYEVRVRFCSPSGPKGFDYAFNGTGMTGMLPQTGDSWSVQTIGKAELKAGTNTFRVNKGWGYYELDSITLVPAPKPKPLMVVTPKPADPKATSEARSLLRVLSENYGKRTLSGQVGLEDEELVVKLSGKSSAVRAGDFMEYSPSRLEHGADPKNHVEDMIALAQKGAAVTMLWHWNAPKDLLDKKFKNERGEEVDASWYKGFYTNATTFDVKKAMNDPKSEEYRLILRDIDAIAVQLKKFSDAKVPVLWRPLHESDGGWFWWGAKGAEPCKKLWRLMFDRLTNKHGLHNLIWVLTTSHPDWYPGDDVVDLIGVDAYPTDPGDALTGAWDELIQRFDGKKMLALTEFGGVPDVEKLFRFGVRWAYFVSWQGDNGPAKSPPEDVRRVYRSDRTVTLDEMPRL